VATLGILQNMLIGSWPLAVIASFAAGILTSFSPCVMAMTPLMLGYVGAWGGHDKWRNLLLVLSLVAGLAGAFAILGLVAAFIGGIFGHFSTTVPLLLAAVLVVMGLSLMKLVHLPTCGLSKWPLKIGGKRGAFLTGLMFGVAASPCATGFVAVIMSLAAVSGQPLVGASLLFAYGLGHGAPLVVVGLAAGTLKSWRRFSQYWDYFSFVAGLLILAVGVYLFATWL